MRAALVGQLATSQPKVRDAAPAEVEHLLRWFWAISRGRSWNGFTLSPISWEAISAWSSLTGERPEPWQIAALFDLDAEYLAHMRKSPDGAPPDEAPVPLTPGVILDAFGPKGLL